MIVFLYALSLVLLRTADATPLHFPSPLDPPTTLNYPTSEQALLVRPGYHFTRRSGWMNDPVPFYDEGSGRFHLFHLCDPNSTKAPWAGGWQGWCHASSPDMATSWVTHEVAIPVESPGTGSAVALPPGGRDRVELDGRAAIMTACSAPYAPQLWVSADVNLTQWRRVGSVNLPNVTGVVSGVVSSADVHVWRDQKRSTWRLITSGITADPSTLPVILHYESVDSLRSGWRFTGVLHGGTSGTSNRVECPSYSSAVTGSTRALVSPALLVYSEPSGSYQSFWASGTEVANGSFTPAHHSQLEYGIGYAAEMTDTWPGRLILFSWMRGVSDGATYVGAQSLPREMRLLADGSVMVHPAVELDALIVAASTVTTNLTTQPGQPSQRLPQRVPQQARLRFLARLHGMIDSLPASFGMTLHNNSTDLEDLQVHDGAAAEAAVEQLAQLQLGITVKTGSACASIDSRQGCAVIGAPTISADGTWAMNATAEVWLDNGLVEVYVGDGAAVLSAFYPRLYGPTPETGLDGSVWSRSSNAMAGFLLEWSTVASATFA